MRIAIIDESAARASIICEGLATLGDCALLVVTERRGLLARIAQIDPDIVLMDLDTRGLPEPKSYAEMRKAAMNQGKRIIDIAEAIVTAHNLLGGAA
jgi:response regulator NasT